MHFLARLTSLSGWRRDAGLFINGAACTALFSPFDFWPLLPFLISGFFLMLDAATSARRASRDGFWFGYGYFMAGTYWIAISMTVEAERFAWMIPFSVLGLSAVLALYFLVFGLLYQRLKAATLLSRLLLFTALWASMEWLRSLGILGFPWNAIGYAWVEVPALLQLASITGIYGLNILAIAVGIAIVPFLRRSTGRAAYFSIGTLICIIAAYGYGISHASHTPSASEEAIRIRVVQGNIPQTMKWDAAQQTEILRIYRGLSHLETDGAQPNIVIWPETALPFAVDTGLSDIAYIREMVPQGTSLITGVVRTEKDRLTNALMALDSGGKIAWYNKRQLVPFGEFIPLRSVLPLKRIAPGPRDFDRGNAMQPLVVTPHIPSLQSMVCYESIFPWAAEHRERARWLVTITNDAWFGRSIGPYQHLAMGRVRAVEQGLPLVRAANTGISAVIDANGVVLKHLNLNVSGIIDMVLPPASPKTLYAKYGNIISLIMVLTIFLLALHYRGST